MRRLLFDEREGSIMVIALGCRKHTPFIVDNIFKFSIAPKRVSLYRLPSIRIASNVGGHRRETVFGGKFRCV